MNWSGNNKSDMDKIMKAHLLEPQKFNFQGEELTFVPSLKELSKSKMSKFIEDVILFMVENDLNPPEFV